MAYRVEIGPAAQRQIRKLPGVARRQVIDCLAGLAGEPRGYGCEKLTAPDDLYPVRSGDYRVVYEIDDEHHVALVWKVAHRRDVYRDR